MLSDLGHASPIEHASFTFGIEGVSRTLLAQITRHRIASFSVQSQRYVRLDDFRYVIPPEIEAIPEAKTAFIESMNEDARRYLDLVQKLEDGPPALLVNTARGGLIVEEDLAWALQNHVIAGAALDVLTEEPMGDTPLMGLPNCIITPHCAWTPLETRMRLIQIAEDNLRCYLDGEPRNVVAKPKPPRIFDPFFLDHM